MPNQNNPGRDESGFSDPQRQIAPAETFGAFFQREFFAVVLVAQAVSGNPSVGEDIAADAMLKAAEKWEKVSGYDKPGAWVRRVAINLAHNKRKRAVVHRSWLAREARQQRAANKTAVQPEVDDELWAAVSELPKGQRAAIALHYIDDLPVAEIAQILGCSTSTATSHLHKGRTQLQHKLGKGATS